MIKDRGNKIIVRSQFNIGGSRGKSVKPFITEYVSRDSACDPTLSYISPNGVLEQGDGVAFTLNNTSISRQETLRIADVVEDYFQEGNRAIQQMVISFSPEYLVDQGIVDQNTVVMKKGDYQFEYDDVRLRHAIRHGVQTLTDLENYRDPQMVAAIQHDTLHLHAHVVVYENYPELARMRGKEEKGVIKGSSFNHMTDSIDRHLTMSKSKAQPCERKLIPKREAKTETVSNTPIVIDTTLWARYMQLFNELEEARRVEDEQTIHEELDTLQAEIDIDDFMNNFYEQNLQREQTHNMDADVQLQ